jgi:hypothetical protein
MLTFADGNGCSLFTTSGKHAKTFQRAVNVGQIGINIPLIGKTEHMILREIFTELYSTVWARGQNQQ